VSVSDSHASSRSSSRTARGSPTFGKRLIDIHKHHSGDEFVPFRRSIAVAGCANDPDYTREMLRPLPIRHRLAEGYRRAPNRCFP
jgi:hypothetical protein